MYVQIQPWPQNRLEMVEARWESTYTTMMSQLYTDLHVRMNTFKSQVAERFTVIEVPDLGDIREEINTHRAKVHLLTESHIPGIPLIIPLVVQSTPSLEPRYFKFFCRG